MGQNIKFLRKLRGMSQRELAEKLSLKRNNIASYEAGIVEPRAVTFIVIARFFDVDPVVLLTQPMDTKREDAQTSVDEPQSGPGRSDAPLPLPPPNPTLQDVRAVVEGLREFYRTKNAQSSSSTEGDQDIESMLSALTSMLTSSDQDQPPQRS